MVIKFVNWGFSLEKYKHVALFIVSCFPEKYKPVALFITISWHGFVVSGTFPIKIQARCSIDHVIILTCFRCKQHTQLTRLYFVGRHQWLNSEKASKLRQRPSNPDLPPAAEKNTTFKFLHIRYKLLKYYFRSD